MDNQTYKIAITSSDGKVVNQHFGRATDFYIVEIAPEEKLKALEKRTFPPVCDGGTHKEENLERTVKALADCKYLLTAKAGDGAKKFLEREGIEVYEIPDVISDAVDRMLRYIKVQELFQN